MRLHRIIDSNMEQVQKTKYDLAFFASGYEQRCTYVARLLNKDAVKQPVVLGFQEYERARQRIENDRYFERCWVGDQISISSDDEGPIYDVLRKMTASTEHTLRLFVDYSSMSRLWYAGILNWARYASNFDEIIIDFLYAVGSHRKSIPPLMISDILTVPGCEGVPMQLSKSVAVFGLGFDSLATLCMLDRLEPDIIYAFLAFPAAFTDYPLRARRSNREIVKKHAKATLELPLKSVEQTFSHLAELVAPYREEADVTLVPMGPKPHVLASILVSMRFEDIVCLRVSGKRERPERVEATGDVVVTTVQFKAETLLSDAQKCIEK